LEEALVKRFAFPNAVLMSNCTAALHVANVLLGLRPGDEAVVSDYTFPATGHAVAYTGARPVFADVRPDTYNIDPDSLASRITPRTKAIVVVHAFGQMAEMDAVRDLAADKGLPVVEDAACALGASYKGKTAGAWGDLACFSFHARKSMTTGEGGLLVLNGALRGREAEARGLASFGATPAFDRERAGDLAPPLFGLLGYNYKLSDIQAAVGIAQLAKFERLLRLRARAAKWWTEALADAPGITLPATARGATHTYQSYVVVVEKRVNRDRLIRLLREKGMQAQIGTYASHLQPVYGKTAACPVSRRLHEQALSLPVYPEMKRTDVAEMARLLVATLSEARR
jgi:dTDP-4-amino-4,6-dideoxygalactose transaminase